MDGSISGKSLIIIERREIQSIGREIVRSAQSLIWYKYNLHFESFLKVVSYIYGNKWSWSIV